MRHVVQRREEVKVVHTCCLSGLIARCRMVKSSPRLWSIEHGSQCLSVVGEQAWHRSAQPEEGAEGHLYRKQR